MAGNSPEHIRELLDGIYRSESRRTARTSSEGELILLEDQDRALWNHEFIIEGIALVERSLSSDRFGPYTLQAAISAMHAGAVEAALTDWRRIVVLYDLLLRSEPSPVIELNRAVAVAMRDGPPAGLALIDAILSRGDLLNYYLAHARRWSNSARWALSKTGENGPSVNQHSLIYAKNYKGDIMYIIREVFHTKPGKAKELVKKFKQAAPYFEKQGMGGFRIMTDIAATYWTVVLETEVKDLADFAREVRGGSSQPEVEKIMAGYMDLVEGGYREIFLIE